MKEAAMALIRPWAQQRLRHPNLSRTLKNTISMIADIPSHSSAAVSDLVTLAESNAAMGRCALCSRGQDRKTKHRCSNCSRPVCPRHIYPVCVECKEAEN